MTVVYDNFNRADSASLGSNWEGDLSAQILSNQLAYGSGGTTVGAAWNANSFTGNQYAQVLLVQRPSDDYAPGPLICAPTAGDGAVGYGYGLCVRSDGAFRITRNTSPVYTSAAGQFANGDVARLEYRGSGQLAVVKNGSDLYTGYTDGTPLTGQYIGLYVYATYDGATGFIIDDWEGGDLTSGAALEGAATGGATASGALVGDVPLAGAATGGATASAALDVTSARSFEFTLYAVDGSTPLASKSGLWWAWWPSIAAMRSAAPDASGTGASTNASGVFSVTAPSSLSAGDNQGFGIISDQDATPDTTEAAFVGSFDVV